ncbi:MAG: CoA transferase, partial [Acidimicrobiales bacterium]
MPHSMLEPYRVLDLTDGRADLSGFVLAGLGADVIKLESPGGSSARFEGPFAVGEPTGSASLSFQSFNRGKRSVVLDLEDPAGRADFLSLVADSDFLLENAGPGVMDRRGLGFVSLSSLQPQLVYVAISPFGQTGPYAEHLATDLTLAAMGGSMALNGDADRRPVRVTVPQSWHHAAAEAALAALVAHERRLSTGGPQFVDVSVQAAVFWTGLN